MHLIIDIRVRDIHHPLIEQFGEFFGNMWKTHQPTDTISYLVNDIGMRKTDSHVVIDTPGKLFGKKRLIAEKNSDIFRYVNFSDFPPYDPTIPTVSHIADNTGFLYPDADSSSWMMRKRQEWERQQLLKQSRVIIVPHIKIGQELVELFGVREDRIEIIPYLPIQSESSHAQHHPYPDASYFLYDGGYGPESNIVGLLAGWEKYQHTWKGKYQLVMAGFAGTELSHLTNILRSLDITDSVRYTGTVSQESYNALYAGAKGWVYTGRDWGGGGRIEKARGYGLPLLLTDLAIFHEYDGIKLHPNHLDTLGRQLLELEQRPVGVNAPMDSERFFHVYKKLLAQA